MPRLYSLLSNFQRSIPVIQKIKYKICGFRFILTKKSLSLNFLISKLKNMKGKKTLDGENVDKLIALADALETNTLKYDIKSIYSEAEQTEVDIIS